MWPWLFRPGQYAEIVDELKEHDGALSINTRRRLAQAAFEQTAHYDSMVSSYLAGSTGALPDRLTWTMKKIADLRYGENPHQQAALYQTSAAPGSPTPRCFPARRCRSTTT